MIVLDTIRHPFSRCWNLASVLTINQHMHYTIELLHTPTARFKFETESFIIRTQIEKLRWINNLRSSHVSRGKTCLSTNDIPAVQILLFHEHDYLMVTHDEISSIQLFYSIKSRDAILRTDM